MGQLEELVPRREFDQILQDPTGQVIATRDEGERVVVSLPDNLQQALIELDDERIGELAPAWGQRDDDYELEADPDDAAAVLRELIGLFRAGKAEGQRGYCWVCV